MPVRRYRRVEDMPGATWYAPGDPALAQAIRGVWGLAHRTIRPHYPPGVHHSRSFGELCARQDEWDDANFLAYRTRLGDRVAPHRATLLPGLDPAGLNRLADGLETEAALRGRR